MRRALLVIACALLATTLVAAALTPSWPPQSPLTSFSGDEGNRTASLSLPWYSVKQWEVDICTQGLSSVVGSVPGSNKIVGSSLSSPLYMDTVTLLAKKVPQDPSNTTFYYEVGWYLQPFTGTMGANVTLIDAHGREQLLEAGTAAVGPPFENYKAFPVPCDSAVYRAACVASSPPVRVKLTWWKTNGTVNWPEQHIISEFILANATE